MSTPPLQLPMPDAIEPAAGPAYSGPAASPSSLTSSRSTPSAPAKENDSVLEELELFLQHEQGLPRWIGWRLRLLVMTVLAACVGIFALAQWVSWQPSIDATWKATSGGAVKLVSTGDANLRVAIGATIISISGAGGSIQIGDPIGLLGSLRWISDDSLRRQYSALRDQLRQVVAWDSDLAPDQPHGAQQFAAQTVTLSFDNGAVLSAQVVPRGLGGLSPVFWLLSALSLVLAIVSMVVLLAGTQSSNLIYALIALAQSGNLLLIALESALDLGAPKAFVAWDWHARACLDLITAACFLQIAAFTPRKLPGYRFISTGGWLIAGGTAALAWAEHSPHAWAWVQGSCTLLGLSAIALMTWSQVREPHPFTMVVRRFAIIAVGTWTLLSVAVAVSGSQPDMRQGITTVGSMIWYVFLASLLLLVPYLTRSQQALREFSLLAATSTVATSLDLLFVAVFSFGQFTSVTLSLAFSLGAYLAARQWLLSHVLGSSRLTMEKLFDRLYRIARELELHPQRSTALVARLMRELFEPLEMLTLSQATQSCAVVGNGSALVVPMSKLRMPGDSPPSSLVVRYAHRGRRMFSSEDARLIDRILDQLHRAVAFAHAVEQGRCEERLRIAQDLHDDIGARLLTLMYQAPSSDIEEYIRHTLQDLKTLTRGLAAQSHRFSEAAGEWKADLTQRLELAHCRLQWTLSYDEDVELGMVQWSATTRILRELVNNVIAHAQASMVSISVALRNDVFDLSVADDGLGCDPGAWKHGLGLGGVRKRVKQLGGTVSWSPNEPQGIVCRVHVPSLLATL